MCFNEGSFLLVKSDDESSLDNVATIIPGDHSLKMIDVYGKTSEITGTIEEIDFMNNRIVLS